MNGNKVNFTQVKCGASAHSRSATHQNSIRKAAIYIRCAQDASCLDLQTHLKTLVEQQENWQLMGVYADVGYSGYNIDRPALGELIKECEVGNIDVIVVDWIKSMSRKIEDCEHLFDVFRRKGIFVYQCGYGEMLEITLKRLQVA